MIISHKYRYLFVELPHTGTTAITKELRLNYDGESILFRHATYQEFLLHATEDEKRYFVFSCIRNPMDDAVSCYFKYRNQVKGFIGFDVESKPSFSDWRDISRRIIYRFRYNRYHYVHDNNADFAQFFLKYYRLPYDNWSSLSHQDFGYIIRFENLQGDFANALSILGIEQVRPLPVVHKTSGRAQNFSTYYTPNTWERAGKVFGPYMEKWGYEFPENWGNITHSRIDEVKYHSLGVVKRFGWRYLRPAVYSLTVRKRDPRAFNHQPADMA